MANEKYDEGRVALATGGVDLSSDTLVLVALDDTYIFDATHTGADINDAVVGSADVTGQTVDSEGWLHSDPAVFTGPGTIGTGDTAVAVVLVDSTADVLLAFYDTITGDQPLTIVGDGTDKTVHPPAEGWYGV